MSNRKAKTLSPAPIFAAEFGGDSIRLSFNQPVGKPWAIERAENFARALQAGVMFRATDARKNLDSANAAITEAETARDALESPYASRLPDDESRARRSARETADAAIVKLRARANEALSDYIRADVAFRAKQAARLKLTGATITHPTVGTIAAATANDGFRAKKQTPADVLRLIRAAIAEGAPLARVAELAAAA